ncbi:MAG: hypothetical protein IT448_10625 [Phycisphaerales bacterium]|nr:hypothetical protein [Phycisphaerales bacterium]
MRSRLKQISATILVCSLALLLTSCFDVPLGEPATSVIDQRLVGYWVNDQADGSRRLAAVAAFDAHVYGMAIHEFSPNAQSDKLKRGTSTFYKAWLTMVDDQPFLTLYPINEMPGLDDNDKPSYAVVRLQIAADHIVVRSLRPDAPQLKNLADSAAFADILRQNLNNPDLYVKDESIIHYRKLDRSNPDDEQLIGLIQN